MASLADLPLRDNLRGLTPYGAPQKQVRVALNVNENTHPIPEGVAHDVVTSLAQALLGINRYPDREFTTLRERLARYVGHEMTADHLWAANGSNEVLQQILQAFGGPGRTVLGFPPTYSMHSIIAAGTDTTWIAGERDPGFELTPSLVTEWIEKTSPDLIFLCAPNNPTGTPLDLDAITAAYDATNGMVVVDEAYAEFAPDGTPSALTLLEGRERLIVSRTMSKAFAFAGARVGYMVADPAVCDAIRLVRLPYHLSALTQAAAIAALDHTDEMLAMVDDIRGQRDRLLAELPKLGFTVWPSEANFVLFGGVHQPHALFEALLERDIIIRDLGIPHHLRVTAGTEQETTLFLETLQDLGGAEFGRQ
ncbi:histidinol-phosphate transaminase [Salinibacterium sp. SYSU T00001]|uniref:histidinol-phosphate transaminase n=1 Tax=Homoserinimonas sedimenticola TaxID=2986805 RepID=UPI00223637D7|nr:histidinol-phosphate transaminase [Salinibacterium sedimenticola]MCW4386779.1 histidinol-phosphate transaminase [Salinibacterium sedimenticola]